MAAVLQRMAVMQAVPSATFDDPDAPEIARLAAAMPADETQLLYTMCLHGRAELGLAPDEYAALTMVLLRLLAFKPGAMAATAALAEKKTPALAQPSPERAAAPASPPAAAAQRSPDSSPPATGMAAAALRATQAAPATASAPSGGAAARGANGPLPPGQVLPVVEQRRREPLPVRDPNAQDVVGVPVRMQPEPQREPSRPPTDFVPTEEGDFWHATVQQLVAGEAVSALSRELALQSQLVARDEGHWLLRVERESLNQGASRERLQTALRAAGHAVELGIEIGAVADSPARRNAAAAAERQKAAEAVIHNDPFVQQMVRDFGAKIVPGSIKPA
jgi:DNA polymerase-3 subunit gamma/tau